MAALIHCGILPLLNDDGILKGAVQPRVKTRLLGGLAFLAYEEG